MQNLKFYDFARLESYGSPFMVACGMRNMGKTYDCSRRAVRRFIKTGAQFVYLRRTKDELVTKDQFFDAFAHEFPDHDFRVIGKEAHIAHASTREDKRRKWEVCGYFAPLTSVNNSGIVYVGPDEHDTVLKLTITSVVDPSKSTTIDIPITGNIVELGYKTRVEPAPAEDGDGETP